MVALRGVSSRHAPLLTGPRLVRTMHVTVRGGGKGVAPPLWAGLRGGMCQKN